MTTNRLLPYSGAEREWNLSVRPNVPDGCKIGAPQKVIYQCSEDGVSDTIKPRLERCGADCKKIAFINEEIYNGLGVYIDITGNKEIYKRPEMVHLLQDCKKGIVNLIFSQTRAYLAANTCDFCFLLKYLFDIPMRVDVVTDDDDQRIDTILDVDNQRQSLKELAEKYTSIREKEYLAWKARLEHEMEKADGK